jgi:hypothetical protein
VVAGEVELDPVYGTISKGKIEGVMVGFGGVELTPSKSRLSSFWRGITVTISISQRKATSVGERPGGRGNAMVD